MKQEDVVEMEELKGQESQRRMSIDDESVVSSQLQMYKEESSLKKLPQKKEFKFGKLCSIVLLVQTIAIVALLLIIRNYSPNDFAQQKTIPLNSSSQGSMIQQLKQTNSQQMIINPTNQQVATKPPNQQIAKKPNNEQLATNKKQENINDVPPVSKPAKAQPQQIEPSPSKLPIQPSAVVWPSNQSDYDMSDQFNLWDMTPQEKASLFKRYRELPSNKKFRQTDNFMQINYGKDVKFQTYMKTFQSNREIIQWSDLNLTQQNIIQLSSEYQYALAERLVNLEKIIKKDTSEYMGKNGFIKESKEITYKQFLDAIQCQKLTGQDFKSQIHLRKIYEREKEYHQATYQVNNFTQELHACVFVPTYNNEVDYRYIWNLESIFQQDYANYRVIIIDDASTDKTAEKIGMHLRWRGVPKEKAIVMRNRNRKTALENIYYAMHKYCDYNQILYIVDGDDQLVGTQAFRLFNAIYQSKKLYVLYSNYFSYDSKNSSQPIQLGLSESYPETVKKEASYRKAYHAYSHLRTMMTDLFLLEKVSSLKDHRGKFYWTIYDNAMYFPALQMSCGRVEYIRELKYWYTANTGINDWRTEKQLEYGMVKRHISDQQNHYHCINHIFQQIEKALQPQSKL